MLTTRVDLPTVPSGQAASSSRSTIVLLHSMPTKFSLGQKDSSPNPSGISKQCILSIKSNPQLQGCGPFLSCHTIICIPPRKFSTLIHTDLLLNSSELRVVRGCVWHLLFAPKTWWWFTIEVKQPYVLPISVRCWWRSPLKIQPKPL